MSGSRAEWVEEAGRVLREQAGIDLVAMRPTMAGESGAAFWITERAGAVMLLKIRPGPAQDAVDYLRKLDAAAGRLRDRGYPAPRYHVIGQAAGVAFWVQERPSGHGRPDGWCAVMTPTCSVGLEVWEVRNGL